MYMLQKTPYKVALDGIDVILDKGKHDLTYPTGDFFYDPWDIKEEFKGTIWEGQNLYKLYSSSRWSKV